MKAQLLIKTAAFLFSILLLIGLFGCNTNGELTTLSDEEALETKTSDSHDPTEENLPEDETAELGIDEETLTAEEETESKETETKDSAMPETGKDSSSPSDSNANNSSSTANPTEEKQATAKKEESKTSESSATKETEKQPASALTATLTIIGPKEDGILLDTTVSFTQGETVLDVLTNGVSRNNVEFTGRGATAYVYGIYGIYEFDYGPRSGWVGRRNGSELTRSSGVTEVKDGDTITWVYLEDFMAGQ